MGRRKFDNYLQEVSQAVAVLLEAGEGGVDMEALKGVPTVAMVPKQWIR